MIAATTAGGRSTTFTLTCRCSSARCCEGEGRLDEWEPWRAEWRAALPDSFRP
jgi:hypothetical protein